MVLSGVGGYSAASYEITMMEAYYPEAPQPSEHLQAGGNGASLPNRDVKVYITNEYYVRSLKVLYLVQ